MRYLVLLSLLGCNYSGPETRDAGPRVVDAAVPDAAPPTADAGSYHYTPECGEGTWRLAFHSVDGEGNCFEDTPSYSPPPELDLYFFVSKDDVRVGVPFLSTSIELELGVSDCRLFFELQNNEYQVRGDAMADIVETPTNVLGQAQYSKLDGLNAQCEHAMKIYGFFRPD